MTGDAIVGRLVLQAAGLAVGAALLVKRRQKAGTAVLGAVTLMTTLWYFLGR